MKKILLTNFTSTIFISSFHNFSDKDFFKYLVNLRIFSYFIFQREKTKDDKEHWQFYGELIRAQLFSKLKRFLNDSHIEERKDSQLKSINYCKKEETRVNNYLEYGNPKLNTRTKKIRKYNDNDNELFLKRVFRKIERGKYSDFFSIEKVEKEKILFWKNQNLLKNIWNSYNPIRQLWISSSKVIWLFGPSGVGKSTWTRNYLINSGYKDSDIASISPQNMTYSNKIYFEIYHENCSVLIINEVDENFPKYNNLISFIDRNVSLVTKGSHIRNNFELIIINSIYRPEVIFSYLGKDISSQVLRRIFDSLIGSKVYEVIKDFDLIDKIKNLSGSNFQLAYKPILKPILEPDYSLVDNKSFT